MKEWTEQHREEMARIAAECREALLEHVVPFWTERVVDPMYGGYFTCFDAEGRLYDFRKPGWFIGRTMFTFSLLCQRFGPRREWMDIVRAGHEFLPRAAVGDGRFAQMLARDGTVLTGPVSIFTDHFAVKGLINELAAQGDQASAEETGRVRRLLDSLLDHVNDPMVLKGECPDERFQKHAVNFMTLTVLIEARKLFGSAYDAQLRECVERSLYQFASDELGAPMEYIGKDGKALPEGPGRLIDAGHTMESLWFSMEAADLLGEKAWYSRAEEVLDWVLRDCWDREYGGFIQHRDFERGEPEAPYLITDYDGTPVGWQDKIWWIQAEGLIALCMSAVRNGNEAHWNRFLELYAYVRKHFTEPRSGEWYSFLHRDGSILSDTLGSTLKGPYHVPRCLMMLISILEETPAE